MKRRVKLEKQQKHIIEIVVDRIIVKEGAESRLAEACELAISHGDGLVSGVMIKTGGSGIRQDFQHQPGLPGAWSQHRGTGTAHVFLQQSFWSMPGL